jgi:hypothetical protein
MSVTLGRYRLGTGVAGGAALVLLAALTPVSALAVPLPASGPTITATVNGIAGAPAYTGLATTVHIEVTNNTLGIIAMPSFTITVPSGFSGVTLGTLSGATFLTNPVSLASTDWHETLLLCGGTPNCSAIVDVNSYDAKTHAFLDADWSRIPVGGTVTATLHLTPRVAGTLAFPISTTDPADLSSVPDPTVNVYDGRPANFRVSVSSPLRVGVLGHVTVAARNSANQPVPFRGGPVTVRLSIADMSLVTRINGQVLTNHRYVVINVPALPAGQAFNFPLLLTLARPQTVTVTATVTGSGSVTGSAGPVKVLAGKPVALRINSIVDASRVPALPIPVANRLFHVNFTAYDKFGNPAGSPVTRVSITALNPVGGKFTVLTPSPTTTATGSGSALATFSYAENGLLLLATAPGLTSGSRRTDVGFAGDSVLGHPGLPAFLRAGFASAALSAGGYGEISLTTVLCAKTDPTCHSGLQANLTGVFSNPSNPAAHLYALAHPAVVRWTCAASRCPHRDFEGTNPSYRLVRGDEAEQTEDFAAYPMQVSLRVPGGYRPFAQAPSCRPLTDPKQFGLTGAITNPAAIRAGFCVDVYAITRVGGVTTGALSLPVLFVEDPKLRGY